MYSTVRVMEHGGRLATLSECPIHLSSCDDEDEDEDGDVVDIDNDGDDDDVYLGDGDEEGDDFEEEKKESMVMWTLYCHFDIAAFLAAPCGRLKNYIAFFSQAN